MRLSLINDIALACDYISHSSGWLNICRLTDYLVYDILHIRSLAFSFLYITPVWHICEVDNCLTYVVNSDPVLYFLMCLFNTVFNLAYCCWSNMSFKLFESTEAEVCLLGFFKLSQIFKLCFDADCTHFSMLPLYNAGPSFDKVDSVWYSKISLNRRGSFLMFVSVLT